MSAVWVVRDTAGGVYDAAMSPIAATRRRAFVDHSVTRETLLTPAQAAVIEVATKYERLRTSFRQRNARSMAQAAALAGAEDEMVVAVRALRAQEGA